MNEVDTLLHEMILDCADGRSPPHTWHHPEDEDEDEAEDEDDGEDGRDSTLSFVYHSHRRNKHMNHSIMIRDDDRVESP
jgi:hypothetical protein